MGDVSTIAPGADVLPLPPPIHPAAPQGAPQASPAPPPPDPLADPRFIGNKQAAEETAPAAPKPKPNPVAVEEQVRALNQLFEGLQNRLEFGIFGSDRELFVKVVDRDSSRVVKVIPSEDLLKLRQKLADSAGVFVDRHA